MIEANKPIESSSVNEIVDCVNTGVYGDLPLSLIQEFEDLPTDLYFDFLRASCVPYLFHAAEGIYIGPSDPIQAFRTVLANLISHIQSLKGNDSFRSFFDVSGEKQRAEFQQDDVARATGVHYGNLFKAFNISQYLEARELLETRLERNAIQLTNIKNKTVLDHGCGGGRYTIAWSLLGTGKSVGLDISEIGIEDARRKLDHLKLSNVEFIVGSVLELPFEDESFDIVYSNGVLHHTTDWEKGIQEQVRVLKKDGFGWQYLIESPGGIFWDKIEILRAILRNVDKNFARKVLALLGVPNNRIFYMLDHVMVPINTRLTQEELFSSLSRAGATKIRRLERGTDFDRVEKIFQNIPFARQKFGVGENRFVFSK